MLFGNDISIIEPAQGSIHNLIHTSKSLMWQSKMDVLEHIHL